MAPALFFCFLVRCSLQCWPSARRWREVFGWAVLQSSKEKTSQFKSVKRGLAFIRLVICNCGRIHLVISLRSARVSCMRGPVQRQQNLNSGGPGGRSQSARISTRFQLNLMARRREQMLNDDRLRIYFVALRGPGSTSLNLPRNFLEPLDLA